ncbi:MAG: Lrp/AsnC ligand binding domain-containing protein [Sedimenticola sp.]|nr:Lrp/AsnC ligand binding domain-containing protein [Sedimenticola sp.]
MPTDFDYLIKVRISDMAAYRELLDKIMLGHPGASDTKSYIVMVGKNKVSPSICGDDPAFTSK